MAHDYESRGFCTRSEFVKRALQICMEYTDADHDEIIKKYNTLDPLPRGYKMIARDPWCAAFVTAVGLLCNGKDIIYPECSCTEMIKEYKSRGLWIDDEEVKPESGWLVFYDWEGDKIADHVGIVWNVSPEYKSFQAIEGNYGGMVKSHRVSFTGMKILGFATPLFVPEKYSEEQTEQATARQWAVDNGLIKGFSEGNYGWLDTPTRSQVAIILHRFYNKFIKGES